MSGWIDASKTQLGDLFRLGYCGIVFDFLRGYLFGYRLGGIIIGKTVGNGVGKSGADLAVDPIGRLQLVFATQRLDDAEYIRRFDFSNRFAADDRENMQLKTSDFLLLGDCLNRVVCPGQPFAADMLTAVDDRYPASMRFWLSAACCLSILACFLVSLGSMPLAI